ncbi:hypothetical protein HU200_010848 [Digitaria exilis]|uniref:Uncharacterized protein n=1 Tax=Digitaria exilis TaxID=1010633 RepID=A0A835FIN8_9POAL|nr:hypothetical protein HU200_010848 [Digitaria exilis]
MTVCKRWRRAIAGSDAGAGFLRRYRSVHAPTVPGHYYNSSTGPVFSPSSPSTVDAHRFSLDFLPGGAGSWTVVDSRGSLLLLWSSRRIGFPDMVVCEPLTRRFEIIPPPAEHINEGCSYLIDGIALETGGRISMSNFRVLCLFCCDGAMRTAMFTAGFLWGEPNICHAVPNLHSTIIMGPAGGKWYFCFRGSILVELDGSTGDFTSSVFPDIGVMDFDMETCNFFVTEFRDGKPRIITEVNSTVEVFGRLDSGEWALEKSILLWEATSGLPGYKDRFFSHYQEILTRGIGFIILSPQFAEPCPYSIDLETMEAKEATADVGPRVYRSELPWPPALHAHLD